MSRPSLVILGSGFGALSVLRTLKAAAFQITVVSPRNHFLFTPLLPSTTVGTIEFRSIVESIHSMRRDIVFHQAQCTRIDAEGHSIDCIEEYGAKHFPLRFDKLVIAVGAANNTYNIPGVVEHALFLRELRDASAIRRRIMQCFEQAGTPGLDEQERRRLLHFVVVGGGPTGVEVAAELHDFLAEDVRRAFPQLHSDVRISLLEAADQILSSFDEELRNYTLVHFRRQRIEVHLRSIVTAVEPQTIVLKDGGRIPFGLLIWSTGIAPTELVTSIPFVKDSHSRIVVDEYLRVKGLADVYAIGDCATIGETRIPATAQVAEQEGKYLGKALNRIAKNKPAEAFQYKHLGMLAYIGGMQALADLSRVKGKGFYTYLFWRSAYLTRLVSWKNKILVLFDWMKTTVFGRDLSQF